MATVTTEQELRDAVAASDPQIIVSNNIVLTQTNTIDYNMELTSNGSVLTWNGAQNAMMFSVVDGATVTAENIVLDALAIYVTLVSVQASTFVMNDGVILRNSSTVAGVPAVAIGISTDLNVGGTFLMNGGLITGVRNDSVISCWGGSIRMSGNAAISLNLAYAFYLQEGTLDMTENARISENSAVLAAMGGRASANSVINMGLAEGDAPRISDNRSTGAVGGIWLEGGATLNMNYGATISGNTATVFGGGVGLSNATLNMSGNAVISGNTTQNGNGGGVYAIAGSQVTMAGNASIFNNRALATNSLGGGVSLQLGGTTSTLIMRENASVYGNSANLGAGLYIGNNTSLVMGVNATDTPSVTGNNSASYCGALFIAVGGVAELSAQSRIVGNTAGTDFGGVCNAGTLRLSQNVQITDGLYFDSAAAAPVIVQALGENALIQLGSNPYIAPENIPIVVAVKGNAYEALTDTDRAAFRAPATLPGIAAILNADQNQVLLVFGVDVLGASISIIYLG